MKLFIGVCNSQDTVPSAFHWSWEEMDKPYEYNKVRFKHTESLIRNNQMVRDFLRSDCDVLVKMDIDQKYPKDYFTIMVPLVEKYKLIGPMIYNKWRKNKYIPLLCNSTNKFPILREIRKDWKRKCKDGILKIKYAHTNLFYAREVLENIAPPWYTTGYSEDHCNLASIQDFSFIDRIREQGFITRINTNVVVGHLAEEVIDAKRSARML
jgi:hypothetical protein